MNAPASLPWWQSYVDVVAALSPRRVLSRMRPKTSLFAGGPGMAWFLQDAGRVLARPALFGRSRAWLQASIEREEPVSKRTAAAQPERGIYTGKMGAALAELVMGTTIHDDAMRERGELRLLEGWSKQRRRPQHEMFFGTAGYLSMIADLARRGMASTAIMQVGEEAYEHALAATKRSIRDGEALGVAHGHAGVLLAMLRWAKTAPHPRLAARLDELAALASEEGDYVVWATHKGARPTDGYWYALCNGLAGHAVLFAEAWLAFGDPRYERLARRIANTIDAAVAPSFHLCCGMAGQAVALQRIARAIDEPRLHRRAVARLRKAATLAATQDPVRGGYLQGPAGVAHQALLLSRRRPFEIVGMVGP